MDNNIEKYQSKELVTRDAQIANALETHPKDWQKEILPGNYIIDMYWHDPYCYRIVSIEPEKDTKLEGLISSKQKYERAIEIQEKIKKYKKKAFHFLYFFLMLFCFFLFFSSHRRRNSYIELTYY